MDRYVIRRLQAPKHPIQLWDTASQAWHHKEHRYSVWNAEWAAKLAQANYGLSQTSEVVTEREVNPIL